MAQVTTEDEDWGTQVRLEVKDGAAPASCRLSRRPRRLRADRHRLERPGHDARRQHHEGASTWHPDQIDHYELRTSGGEHLVTLPAQ